MKKEIVLAVLLVVVILLVGVQAMQLSAIKSTGVSGAATAKPTTTSSSGGGVSVPSNLQNLPSMVGGC